MGKASRRKKIPQSFLATLPASLSNLPFAPGCNQYGKISASLLDLIDPYADDDLPLDTMHKLVGMGVVAWNIASTSNTLDEATAEPLRPRHPGARCIRRHRCRGLSRGRPGSRPAQVPSVSPG